MYTHAYTEYVNHILNNSPSKTTYSFAKAQRFLPSKTQGIIMQPQVQGNQYRDGTKRYGHSLRDNTKGQEYLYQEIRQNDKFDGKYRQSPTRNNERSSRKGQRCLKSKSKSPLPKYSRNLTTRQNIGFIDTKQQYKKHEFPANYPTYEPNFHPTKFCKPPSPKKSNSSKSPYKTNTNQVTQLDQISKNITISGYYPTGLELSPRGKYPISTVRNPPSYKFGNRTSRQRYSYLVRSQDTLGPGYYEEFSEFGHLKM